MSEARAADPLVERARRGDDAAFGALVETHQARVFRAALAVLGSPEEAEDVAQEAFLTAHAKLHTFRGDAAFSTWVGRIAWRAALDRRRSIVRRLKRFVSPPAEDWPEPPSPGPSPEALLLGREERDRTRRAIARLPEGLRDALLMASAGDRSYEEIAELLAIPVGTLKWRVSEARKKLRAALQAEGR
ncbi:MAG: sigma-70 family RNA polymerase sigma factor [Vicinamibacteria bacterium]|nr:sigma-70 family RNA polymerase sigma factor [Vicinamibacteria bacterium]